MPSLAALEGLQDGGPELGGWNRILEDGHRPQPQRLFGPFRMKSREQQNHRHFAVLAPHVRQQLECFGVQRIDTGQHQIDVVALHRAHRDTIGGGLFDDVTQRLEHRGQECKAGGVRIKDQDPKFVHGVILSACVRVVHTNLISPP